MEPTLLAQLDQFVKKQGFLNRSQAIRYIIKEKMFNSLTEKGVIIASVQLPKESLGERFETIVKRCERWGIVHTFTTIFLDYETVCVQFSIEIQTEMIHKMQQDPLLQPITILTKGGELYEANK